METAVLTPESTFKDSFHAFWDARDLSCSLTPDKLTFEDQICPLSPSLDHNNKGILNDDSFAQAFVFSPPKLKMSPKTSGQNMKFPLCGLSPNLNPPATLSMSPMIKPFHPPPLVLPDIDDIGIVTPVNDTTKHRKRKATFIETPQRKRMKMIGSKLKYSCRDCGFKCKKIKNLQALQQLYPEYGNAFYCDECEQNSPSWPMFHCVHPSCEYDVCMRCAWKELDDTGSDNVVTPTNGRADMRLTLEEEDEHFKIKELAEKKIDTPKPPPQKKKPKSGFQLVFARPGINPVGFCPRFDTKKSEKSKRALSFEHVKQALLTNQPSGRGKGQKPPLDLVKGEFIPPSQGKFAVMKRFNKIFFWKSRQQWLAYWPCFEAAFDEFELARLHLVFMEERETESIETSARGRIVKKKHIRPAKVNEELEKEFHRKYAKANPELALILLRVYRFWTAKRHIFADRPWVDRKKRKKSK